jgi:hypothetical protein
LAEAIHQEGEAAGHFLDRLEKMVRLLIGEEYNDGQDLWNLQLDLLQLQHDIQREISRVKKRRVKDQQFRQDISALRWARQEARRFGDAIAWLYLNVDRKLIYPLARNSRVAAAADTHGERAAIELAQALSNDGWGFPLLHDITDCLRIGDITFIRADGIQTVEAKTQVIDEKLDENGEIVTQYKVSLISASPLPTTQRAREVAPDQNDDGRPSRYLTDPPPRVVRQIQRMNEARAHQDAESNRIVEHVGSRFISLNSTIPYGDNNDALKRIVEKAYATGYGSEAVEDTFLYIAIYSADDLTSEAVRDERILHSVQESGIFHQNIPRNSLIVNTIPAGERSGAQLYMPYHLLPLPLANIIDILRNRLLILILTNGGKIIAALEGAGFSIKDDPKRRKEFSFVATSRLEPEDADGAISNIELHNLDMHVREMICEFGSTRNLVEVAVNMRNAARLMARHQTEGQSGSVDAEPRLTL